MRTSYRSAALCVACLVASSIAILAQASLVITGPSGEQRLTVSQLRGMPRQSVTVDDDGKRATYAGVELRHLLAKVGAPPGEAIHGKDLARYVTVEATDGSLAVFALAELDPDFTDRKVILADERDRRPMGEDEGPLRVVVEAEKQMARSVRDVKRISLKSARDK